MKQMVNFGVSVWIKRNPLIVYLQEIIRVYRQTSNKRIKFRMHLLKFSHDNNSQSNILKKETITRNQRNIELRNELLRKIELTYFVAMETDSVTQSHNVAKLITDLIYQISYDVVQKRQKITGSTNIRLSQLTSLGQLFLQIDLQLLYSSSSKNT